MPELTRKPFAAYGSPYTTMRADSAFTGRQSPTFPLLAEHGLGIAYSLYNGFALLRCSSGGSHCSRREDEARHADH